MERHPPDRYITREVALRLRRALQTTPSDSDIVPKGGKPRQVASPNGPVSIIVKYLWRAEFAYRIRIYISRVKGNKFIFSKFASLEAEINHPPIRLALLLRSSTDFRGGWPVNTTYSTGLKSWTIGPSSSLDPWMERGISIQERLGESSRREKIIGLSR